MQNLLGKAAAFSPLNDWILLGIFFFFNKVHLPAPKVFSWEANENSKDIISPKPLPYPSFRTGLEQKFQPLLPRVGHSGFLASSGRQLNHREATPTLGALAEVAKAPCMWACQVKGTGGADHQNGAGCWGRGGFHFPFLTKWNPPLRRYKWNSCSPITNCFRMACTHWFFKGWAKHRETRSAKMRNEVKKTDEDGISKKKKEWWERSHELKNCCSRLVSGPSTSGWWLEGQQ